MMHMIHPHTALRYINQEIGYGVVATRFIPRGTLTWILDTFDYVFTLEQVRAMDPTSQDIVAHYAYINAAGNFILCWDLGRYINHSCHPTSLGIGENVEVAVRDIHPGEQLTSDYGMLNVTADLHCQCGASTCRGRIHKDDLLHHWQDWDALVSATLALVTHVPQPLWPFLPAPARLLAILQQKEPLPSHLHAYSSQSLAGARALSDGPSSPQGLWAFATTS